MDTLLSQLDREVAEWKSQLFSQSTKQKLLDPVGSKYLAFPEHPTPVWVEYPPPPPDLT